MEEIKIVCYLKRTLMFVGFKIILLVGVVNSFIFNPKSAGKNYKKKFSGFLDKFEEIYFNYVYRRISDCSHSPVSSNVGSKIWLNERVTEDYGWTYRATGERREYINLGSFNYLGLNETSLDEFDELSCALDEYGVAMCSPHFENGMTPLHYELEKLTAEFLGMEDVITCCTGFATNALNLPVILSEECLVLSDERNHASMISGIRLSKAKVLKYSHVDLKDLETKIVESLYNNERSGGLLFSKLFILTEGIYSMDGTIINLPKLIELKKKYQAYLYIDDAHGVGILGANCRGIIDLYDGDPSDIDIVMGTYSKAFASNGGFIAGNKELIDYLRTNSFIHYGSTMPPVAVQKAILSLKRVMAARGSINGNTLGNKLKENAHYLRKKLKEMGLNVCGHEDSHIIPWVLGSISAVSFVVRELKKRNIATAGVIYPATPLLASRIRLSVSASHTKQDLDQVVEEIKDLTVRYGLN